MAEKEERYISITQMVAKENIETEKYRVIPRQEAINRIEEVLEEGWWSGKTFRHLSEAALNALLEADK